MKFAGQNSGAAAVVLTVGLIASSCVAPTNTIRSKGDISPSQITISDYNF